MAYVQPAYIIKLCYLKKQYLRYNNLGIFSSQYAYIYIYSFLNKRKTTLCKEKLGRRSCLSWQREREL
jgi:hypothetical protein